MSGIRDKLECPECKKYIKYMNNNIKDYDRKTANKLLGDINKSGSCAYCLYWNAGPGAEDSDCPCDNTFIRVTDFGSKFTTDDYLKVKKCVDRDAKLDTPKCTTLKNNFEVPAQPYEGPHFGIAQNAALPVCACSKKNCMTAKQIYPPYTGLLRRYEGVI
jgi:hypothetical protein|uniref:Uncharacterized protein n=1 Tax=viral metagenome TaxID=1070528 RepID=A0A6C0CYX7_9ZZZZ